MCCHSNLKSNCNLVGLLWYDDIWYKEGWAPKNWFFWTAVLEKTLESSLDCEEINQSILKEINPEYSLEDLILKLKLPYFGPSDEKSRFTGKDPDAAKDWGQEEKRVTEDEMVGWHHWLNGGESDQTPGDSGGQGGLARCSPWGHKGSDTSEGLNNNKNNVGKLILV